MEGLCLEVPYDRKRIEALSRVQYNVSQAGRKAVTWAVGVVCLLLGARLVGGIREPWNYLFALYGCFSIAFVNVPARWRAEKICQAIEKSGRSYPCSLLAFDGEGFTANTKGNPGAGERHAYRDCFRLVRTRDALYYFINRDAAFPLPFSDIPEGRREAFASFLEERTGLRFISPLSLWNLGLRGIMKVS